MKILYISSSSDWHIDLWTQYFTKENKVFLFSEKEDYLNDQPYENVTVIKSSGLIGKFLNYFKFRSHKFFQLNKLISARFYASKIDALIECQNIDIVHAHNLYYGYVASFLKTNIPVIFTPMGSDVIIGAQNNVIYNHMAKKAFAKAHSVTGDSVLLQRRGFQVNAPRDRNYIIQNGVDSSIFYPRVNSLKQEFDVGEDEFLFFSPRAITPLYNIDTIIEALCKLKDTNLRFKCMFSYAFGGEYYLHLKNKVKSLGLQNYVIWLGYVRYENMPRYYNAADVVISVPSSDSSPKSVYEAMFCGKPVIISDLEWSHELLDELECVCRVDAENSEQLADAVNRFIFDPEFSSRVSQNSLHLAQKYFDYTKNMKKMEAIMLDCLA